MLEQSVTIGRLSLTNRLAMAPVDMEQSDRGTVTDEQIRFYDERTKGGCVGLVIVEHSFVRPDGRARENQLSCASDADVDGLSRLAEVLHRNGSRAFLQLSHAGTKAAEMGDGLAGVSPDGSAGDAGHRPTRPMETGEAGPLTEAFVRAALRAEKAGFDGVEIHSAHGYLLNQFFSPLTNHRTDRYGSGTVADRARLHCEILSAVRKALCPDTVVGIRFGACDYLEGGSTVGDGVQAARMLEEAGAQFFDVSGGMCGPRRAGMETAGYFRDSASAVRKAVSAPVILAGGVRTREDAESLLTEGCTDLIAVARAIIADADWARKALKE